MTRKLAVLALALIGSLLVHAQDSTSISEGSAADGILKSENVVAARSVLDANSRTRSELISRLGFSDGLMCTAPQAVAASSIDFHRTLFVHDSATLGAGNFGLRRTLQQLANNAAERGVNTWPEAIFRQLWDVQNDTAHQVLADNVHCDDNEGKINGFPLNSCPRSEGSEAAGTRAEIASRIDNAYKPLALVNRIDLATKGWGNCGEYRIIYGRHVNTRGSNLIIFEAVLPNPKPGCRSGCREVIDFWMDLSRDSNPASRARKLEKFFFVGLNGFRPVVHTDHYTSGTSSLYASGSGQIRTNQFFISPILGGGGPWTLKEFKTFLSCSGGICDYDILPVSVKVNPYGPLWNGDVALGKLLRRPGSNRYATPIPNLATLAQSFQGNVLAQVDRLAKGNLNSISYEVPVDKNAAESQSLFPDIDHYPDQFNSSVDTTFKNNLHELAASYGLTAQQIVNRATANSCAGCHQPSNFGLTNPNAIGPGMSWPHALSFVHVDPAPPTSLVGEPGFDAANFAGNPNGFPISPGLQKVFLPARRNTLVSLANMDTCDCVPRSKFPGANESLTSVSLAPDTVVLSDTALSPDQLKQSKMDKLSRIINAEPPRETISGSFRSH